MKERIKEFVYSICGDNSLIKSLVRKTLKTAINEALELAAKECEKYDNGRHANYADICADSIRKLKV